MGLRVGWGVDPRTASGSVVPVCLGGAAYVALHRHAYRRDRQRQRERWWGARHPKNNRQLPCAKALGQDSRYLPLGQTNLAFPLFCNPHSTPQWSPEASAAEDENGVGMGTILCPKKSGMLSSARTKPALLHQCSRTGPRGHLAS